MPPPSWTQVPNYHYISLCVRVCLYEWQKWDGCWFIAEEVRQAAGPDVIWRLADDCIPFVFEWKLGGAAVKKPQVWSPLGLYRHVIISFMTFWPCRTSSGFILLTIEVPLMSGCAQNHDSAQDSCKGTCVKFGD